MPIAQIGREIFCKGQRQLFLPDKHSTERIAMSASNPFLQRALRFCEVCGLFVGNMNVKEWDQASHLCKECDETYGNPRMILMNNIPEPWKTLHTSR